MIMNTAIQNEDIFGKMKGRFDNDEYSEIIH